MGPPISTLTQQTPARISQFPYGLFCSYAAVMKFPVCTAFIGLTLLVTAGGIAAGPRVLPEGERPSDHRLGPLKDLDGYFPFNPPATKEAWEPRAEVVRRRVLIATGLWPMPEKTPLNAVIHGRIDRDTYTMEKVYFESRPGFFVTGNLYRPKNPNGRIPGVLFAHGHWTDARLSEAGETELNQEIATGQERFVQGGRSRFQSMCVQLARMGCVVFQYDMLGNSDSQQIPMSVAHTFGKQRPQLNQVADWGLYSPQAESHLQSIMGFQTWNSVRSLDFLLSLPEVDPQRIACTGASGGGTQTFILGAVDPRVKLSFPAVMVSTAMQGGCTCENASLLRIGTGNVELAALFAPKPQGMTTANDWTKEMASKGFPDLKKLYGLYGASDKVMLHRGEHFPHNYNAISRMAFYSWLNKNFKLGAKEPVLEQDYVVSTKAEMTVWDGAHPQPPGGEDFERRLLREENAAAQKQLQAAARDATAFGKTFAPAWEILLDADPRAAGEVTWVQKTKTDRGDWIEMGGLIQNTTHQEEVPTIFLFPKNWNSRTVIWLTGMGKSGLYGNDGELIPAVRKLVAGGTTVVGADLVYQGEFTRDGNPLKTAPVVANPREVPAYTFGYNNSLLVWRMHDVVSLAKYIRNHERKSSWIGLVGMDGAAPVAAAARFALGNQIDRTVVDTGGFRFGKLLDYRSPDFLPGAAKYGDLPGLLAAGGSGEVRVAAESASEIADWRSRFPHASAKIVALTEAGNESLAAAVMP